jgi:hypothetical protein
VCDETIKWSAAPQHQPEEGEPLKRRGHERAQVLAKCQNPDCGWQGYVTPDKLNTASCPECGTGMLAQVSE